MTLTQRPDALVITGKQASPSLAAFEVVVYPRADIGDHKSDTNQEKDIASPAAKELKAHNSTNEYDAEDDESDAGEGADDLPAPMLAAFVETVGQSVVGPALLAVASDELSVVE